MNVIKINNGKVEIRDDRGNLKRTICNNDAVIARWTGNDIAIQTTKGKTEIRSETGNLLRSI